MREGLVGAVDVGEGEGTLVDGDAFGAAELHDHSPRDAVEAVVPGRRPHLAPSHDEEVGSVARRDGPGRVEHEGLVGAGLEGLYERHDLVELAVGVEALIQRVGRRASHRRGEEPYARGPCPGVHRLVLGDDHDVRAAGREPRVLRRGLLVPAGDHQAQVDAGGHTVSLDRLVERFRDLLARHADVEVYGLGALEEAVEVEVEERELAALQPDAFPHAVADEEAGVEDGDFGLRPPVELAVDVHEDVLVSLVRQRLVRPSRHLSPPARWPRQRIVASRAPWCRW